MGNEFDSGTPVSMDRRASNQPYPRVQRQNTRVAVPCLPRIIPRFDDVGDDVLEDHLGTLSRRLVEDPIEMIFGQHCSGRSETDMCVSALIKKVIGSRHLPQRQGPVETMSLQDG